MTDHTAREALASIIRSVTDLWDEPLDEVHDVPKIVDALLASPALDAVLAERVAALAEDEAMVERINRSSLDYSTLFAGRAPLEIVAVLRALAAALTERGQS